MYIPLSKYVGSNSSNEELAFYNYKNEESFGEGNENSEFRERPSKRNSDAIQSDDGTSSKEDTIIDEDGASDSSLEDYLSKLNCNGCGKHCPLSNPRCNRGVAMAQEAAEEYNNSNNTSSQSQSSSENI